ncbi:MAG: hypothetical protein H6706_22000 [Myxococcales bacterium]|nr:hypothetical protein [Myxococcales bacterium]
MAVYFFLPSIPGDSLDPRHADPAFYALVRADGYFSELLGGLNYRREVAGKSEVQLLGRDASLADLQAGDRLYVFGHGDLHGQQIRTRWEGGVSVSPEDLATLLQHAGLPDLEGLNIKLFACNTGVRHDGRTYAHRVAEALSRLGYARVLVSGYVGVVTLGDGQHKRVHKRFSNDGSELSKGKVASHRRVTYDMTGWIVDGQEGRATEGKMFTRVRNV